MLAYPNAKINIGLHIVARRPDGYHDLETVFYPIPLQDALETRPLRGSNAPFALQIVGLEVGGRPEDNLVVKVCEDLRAEFGFPPQDIWLDKHIPMGAGLGGGSSDAATMMRLLNDVYDLGLSPEDMERRLAGYGADCAFFVRQRAAYATGIGDRLSPIDLSLRGLAIILVKPPVSVSTREAYAGVSPQQPEVDLREALSRPVETWRDCVINDFEASVFPQHPEIAAIKDTLYDMGALYAAMSGSGSTVYGLFHHELEEAPRVFQDCFVFQRILRL